MKKLLRSEKGRLLIAVLLIALVVAVNALVGALGLPRADLTADRVMTPSQEALEIVRTIDTPATIIFIADDDSDDIWVGELSRRYADANDNVSYKTMSTDSAALSALSAKTGLTLAVGNVVVESEKRCAVLTGDDLYSYDFDKSTYYMTGVKNYTRADFTAQNALVNALLYVSRDDMPTLYMLTGHGEPQQNAKLFLICRRNNIAFKTLDLSKAGAVPDDAAALLHQTTSQLYRMAESYERGRILREGVPCVILGRPNAGKSTLLNTLLGRERAIVTDIPGTTRDLIEENVKVGQILLRVTDTAGLRDTTDPVEQAGIDRAMAEASASALILAVFDGSKAIGEEDMLVLARSAGHRAIAVLNKADLPQQLDEELLKKQFAHIVHLSAKTGEGMDRLLSLIPRTIGFGETAFDGALITNARQAAALARAAERCEAALYAAQCGMTPDAVVMDAEGAIAALGEITGETVTESVVTRIFSDFCVGK